MIKMKNILAENMLRFGVKNLKESDVEKINQTSLTEDDNASKNQIATPNYWFSNSYNNGGDGGGKNYVIECPEKEKVTSHVTGLTGIANRTQTPVQCYIPNSVKGAAAISSFLQTGKVGDKAYFDPAVGKGKQKDKNEKAPEFVYQQQQDISATAYIKIMSAKKSYFSGKDKYGKPYAYGVNAEGVTNLWELICKMLEKLHG